MTPDEFLRHWRIGCFYHFTDMRNIDSIRTAGGLHSLAELARRNIQIPAPGGNDWSHEADEFFGLDEYVHLCLIAEHPMEYIAKKDGRITYSRFLEIDADVLRNHDVRFSPGVSNKSDVPILTLEQAIGEMDFEVLFTRTNWRDPVIKERRKAATKYELLIPRSVPIAKIRGL